MFAVCEALRVAALPIHIHTNHLPIVDGLRRGKQCCTAAARSNANLWRVIWDRLEDLGGLSEDLQFPWVPGYATGNGIDAVGNRSADTLAKDGQQMHGAKRETLSTAKAIRRKQKQILRWIGRAASYTGKHGTPPDRQPK